MPGPFDPLGSDRFNEEIQAGLKRATSASTTPTPWETRLMTLAVSGVHIYLSTFCYHGTHAACGAAQHARGDSKPPHCKGCESCCICPRHTDPDAPCWGGDNERVHDESCALDADHLGWCGPGSGAEIERARIVAWLRNVISNGTHVDPAVSARTFADMIEKGIPR